MAQDSPEYWRVRDKGRHLWSTWIHARMHALTSAYHTHIRTHIASEFKGGRVDEGASRLDERVHAVWLSPPAVMLVQPGSANCDAVLTPFPDSPSRAPCAGPPSEKRVRLPCAAMQLQPRRPPPRQEGCSPVGGGTMALQMLPPVNTARCHPAAPALGPCHMSAGDPTTAPHVSCGVLARLPRHPEQAGDLSPLPSVDGR